MFHGYIQLMFFFLPCLFLVLLYPFCSAFEVSLIFTLLLCRVFHLFIYFFILLKEHFLGGGGGGGVSAKLMFGYNMGGGATFSIHWPGWCFWLCPVEFANVPGWQMTTRHSFPRLGPNPRVISLVTSYRESTKSLYMQCIWLSLEKKIEKKGFFQDNTKQVLSSKTFRSQRHHQVLTLFSVHSVCVRGGSDFFFLIWNVKLVATEHFSEERVFKSSTLNQKQLVTILRK